MIPHRQRRKTLRNEMFQINRLIFCVWLLSAQCLCNANITFSSIDFERIKDRLFSNEGLGNVSGQRLSSDDGYNASECRKELIAIGNSLQNPDFWAIQSEFNCKLRKSRSFKEKKNVFLLKIVSDSWGKLPSGISSGNAYDFGAFSQCLHSERDGQHYPTQYCIGMIVFGLNDVLPKNVRTRIGLLDENGGVIPRSMISK